MSATINERELVMEVLLSITRDGEYSHIALRNTLEKYQFLDKKQRSFITRVTEGTLERMIELDYIINQFSNVKVNKMKPVIRTIVRSAVYQLKYMDSVPNSAVCNEAVKLAIKKRFVNLKGFVNGVLRTIDRNLEKIVWPDGSEGVRRLSVVYSMPEWIIDEWLSAFGEEQTESILQEFFKERSTTIRCNLQKNSVEELCRILKEEGVKITEFLELPYALGIENYDYLGKLESFQDGRFYVQDMSSMFVAEWADVKDLDYVIDVCAAPGGKALHIAEKLSGTGYVEARDLTEYKVNLIRENIERSGLQNIKTIQKDALVYDAEDKEKADVVIADLPCSGLGVIAKKADLKYKMTKEAQVQLAKLQREILTVVQAYVKQGGTLLYSTCTINEEENQKNAKWFEAAFPKFTLQKDCQMLPGRAHCDGFYIAVFRKE